MFFVLSKKKNRFKTVLQIDGPRHMLRYTGPINRALVEQGVKRTSSLLAPIMLLEGNFAFS